MSPVLRPYASADEEAVIDLWQRAWQQAYPQIAFAKRLAWWRGRWRNDLVPLAAIILAEDAGSLTGFFTIDRNSGYLDQLAVAPECWGKGIGRLLLDEAKRLAPRVIELDVNQDNARALHLYGSAGFKIAGTGTNPHSGAAVYRMIWRA